MNLIWLDLETTGLDPRVHRIIEVAAFIATLDKPFDVKPLYHAVTNCHPVAKKAADQTVLEMHAKNGLWEEALVSKTLIQFADQALAAKIPDVTDPKEKPVLAGASIHFDHDFLKVQMALTAAKLSHRHYDVSAVKLFARSLGMPKLDGDTAHRAEADVIEAVGQARAVARWFDSRRA